MGTSMLALLHTVGVLGGQDAEFTYEPGKDGGCLLIRREDGTEDVIYNKNVLGVWSHEDDTNKGSEIIILLVVESQPSTAEDSKGKHQYQELQAMNLPHAFVDANRVSPYISSLSKADPTTSASNLHVVISTLSGTGEAEKYFGDVVKEAFKSYGVSDSAYTLHTTTSGKSVEDLARTVLLPNANEGHPQVVLLLSGDGGIADILNVLLTSERSGKYLKPAIGLIAMGTGNALANSTGLNRDSTRGLRHFFRGIPRPLPTFTVELSPGCEFLTDEGRRSEPLSTRDSDNGVTSGAVVCSWALHASLVADSDTTEYRRFGSQRFLMAAKELLDPSDGSSPHVYHGKVTLIKRNEEGQIYRQELARQEHMYVLATMVSNLEEKLAISPHATPLDGQLRLLHFGPMSSAEVMRIMGLAFQGGRHIEDPAVGYEKIEGLRIDFEEVDSRWRRVCVDGKIIRVGEDGWLEVQKSREDVLDVVMATEP